jgi:hypothetical protein
VCRWHAARSASTCTWVPTTCPRCAPTASRTSRSPVSRDKAPSRFRSLVRTWEEKKVFFLLTTFRRKPYQSVRQRL